MGACGVTTEFFPDMGLPELHLGALGLLLMSLLLGALVLRYGFLGAGARTPFGALELLGVIGGALSIASLAALGPRQEWAVFGCALVLAWGVWASVREATLRTATHDEGKRRVMLLGAYSEQMAHDLRNPLTAIWGAASELQADADQLSADQQELVAMVVTQAKRMSLMISDSMQLGQLELQRGRVDVVELVRRAVHLTPALSSLVTVKTELQPDILLLDVDGEMLLRCRENILRNACDAMPDGGALSVVGGVSKSGDWCLRVSDTGVGMSPDELTCAFDEFYTTKAGGRGIGLSYVRRVLRAHGGEALAHSASGQGTTLSLFLPTVPREP